MKIKTLLLSTVILGMAAQAEARPIRNLRPEQSSVEINLSVLSSLKPEYEYVQPQHQSKKSGISKKHLKALPGTENSPKLSHKIIPEIQPSAEPKKIEKRPKIKQADENQPQVVPPILPPPTNLLPKAPEETPSLPPPPMVIHAPVVPTPPPAMPPLPIPPAPQAKPEIKVPEIKAPVIKAPEVKASAPIKVPELAPPPPPPLPPAATTNGQRVVQLPPLDFDDTQKQTPAAKTANLPPVSNLFPETKTAMPPVDLPPPPAAPALPPEPKVGKPFTDTVMIDAPKLPATEISATPNLSIPLTTVENELPVSREGDISGLAAKLKADPKLILTIKSYAAGTEEQASQAKRTSLARALSVRKYLMEKEDIKSDRISVRPMGNKNEGGVPDRIDIFLESGTSQKG